jgi:hypothetical protein
MLNPTSTPSYPPACVRSTKALSRYTDMADSLTRSLRDKLASATDTARIRLKVCVL